MKVEIDRSLELTGQLVSPQVPPSETRWVNPEEQDPRLTSGLHTQPHIHVLAHVWACTHIHTQADTQVPSYIHRSTYLGICTKWGL